METHTRKKKIIKRKVNAEPSAPEVDIERHGSPPSPFRQLIPNDMNQHSILAQNNSIPVKPPPQNPQQFYEQKHRNQAQLTEKPVEKKKKRVKKIIKQSETLQAPIPQQPFVKSSTPNPNARQPSVTPGILEMSMIEKQEGRELKASVSARSNVFIKSKQVTDALDNIYQPRVSRSPSLIASGNVELEQVKQQNQQLFQKLEAMEQNQQRSERMFAEVAERLTDQLKQQSEISSERNKTEKLNNQYEFLQQQLQQMNAPKIQEGNSHFVQGTNMTIDENAGSFYAARPTDLSFLNQRQEQQDNKINSTSNTKQQDYRVRFADYPAPTSAQLQTSIHQNANAVQTSMISQNPNPLSQVKDQDYIQVLEARVQALTQQVQQISPFQAPFRSTDQNLIEQIRQLTNQVQQLTTQSQQPFQNQQQVNYYQMQYENQVRQNAILNDQQHETSALLLLNQKQCQEMISKSAQISMVSPQDVSIRQKSAMTSMQYIKPEKSSKYLSSAESVSQSGDAQPPTIWDQKTAQLLSGLSQVYYQVPRRTIKEVTRFLFADGY